MAEFQNRGRWNIFDYLTYNKDKIPLFGELRYFSFSSTYSFVKNICHVIGDGTKKINQLPFIEVMIIESSVNFSLNDFRISGNTVRIHNTHATNSIIINIGTTGSPINYSLKAGDMVLFKFNGASWIEQKKTGDSTLKISTDYIIQNNETYTYYITTNNIKITLPVLSSSQNRETFFIKNSDSNMKRILVQGGNTINGLTEIRLYKSGDFVRIIPTATQFLITDQNVTLDSGRINTNDWTFRSLGFSNVNYDNLTGTINIGDIVTGVTSLATGKVIGFNATTIVLYEVTNGGIFINNETINFTGGASALVDEPTGNNKNKDTNIYLFAMGNRIEKVNKKFIIYQMNTDISYIEKKELSFTTTPAANTIYGASYFYIADYAVRFTTATDGLDYVSISGTRIAITTQDWYYRHVFKIRY